MSASENDPTFARVWVKDEPDENIADEIDGIASDHHEDDNDLDNDDDDDDDEYTETAHVDIDPMGIVKNETQTSETEEQDDHWKTIKVKEKWVTKTGSEREVEKLKCPFCPYEGKPKLLKAHIRKHTNKKEFKCPFCSFNTNYNTALRRHLKIKHSGDSDDEKKVKKVHMKKFQCALCPYVTAHRHGLKSHMKGKHQDEKPHQCSFCDYKTKYSTALHRHRFTQHKNEVKELGEASREFKCSSCDFVAFLNSELRQHERKHVLKFRCKQCGYKTDTEEDLQQHMMKHDDPNFKAFKFKMPSVKKEAVVTSQLGGNSTDPIFKCKICEHESITYVAFLEHVKSHEKVDPYKCNVCGYETASNTTFLEHLQIEHGVTEDGMNDVKVINEGIMSAMQAISMGVTPDSDDEPLASLPFRDDSDEEPKAKPKRKRLLNKTFACEVCPYSTKYKDALKSHMRKHTEGKPYKCTLCDYSSKYPTAMRRHKMLKHPESFSSASKPKEYVCHECSYRTYYKANLFQHFRKHNPDKAKQFKCESCPFATAYQTAFYRHRKIHKRKLANGQIITHQCDMCPYSTQHEGRFSWHMLKTHNKRGVFEKGIKCDYCDFETYKKLKFRLTAHLQRSKQMMPMKCLHCDFETYYKCQVRFHRKTHYPELQSITRVPKSEDASQNANPPENVEAPAPSLNLILGHCKEDNYEVDSAIAWKKIPVLENRSLNKPFSCYKCSYASRFKSSVQRHYQRLHGNKAKPYRCSHCDFGTSTKDSIALHTKRSKQNNAMECECGQFATFYKCEFVVHQKLHNPYRCSKCTYSSKSKYDLERHYTMHSNKGYKCEHCDYVAARRDTLSTHAVTHTGIKPYQCHLCPYGTMRLTFLEKHIIDKHDGDASKTKPFQCHLCPYGSFRQGVLDRHILQEHAETNDVAVDDCNDNVQNDDAQNNDTHNDSAQNDDTHNDDDSIGNVADTQTPTLNTSYYDLSTRNNITIESPAVANANDSQYPTPTEKLTQEKGVKPFQCTVCPYSAFSPKVLKKHMTIHTDVRVDSIDEAADATVKPFQCHLCPYSSFRPNILKNHLILKHSITPPAGFVDEYNTKTTEKTYQCHICPYSSMSINVLNKHLAIKHETTAATALENTVKTFQCHHCPFNSLNPNVLKKHVIQSHSGRSEVQTEGAKPFRCQFCPYSSFSPKVLRKHLMQKHSGLPRSAFETYSDNSVEVVSVASEND